MTPGAAALLGAIFGFHVGVVISLGPLADLLRESTKRQCNSEHESSEGAP